MSCFVSVGNAAANIYRFATRTCRKCLTFVCNVVVAPRSHEEICLWAVPVNTSSNFVCPTFPVSIVLKFGPPSNAQRGTMVGGGGGEVAKARDTESDDCAKYFHEILELWNAQVFKNRLIFLGITARYVSFHIRLASRSHSSDHLLWFMGTLR